MRTAIEPTEAMKSLEKREQSDIITQTRHYKLITPLFGGGVTPGMVDDITPIRGTAVRGHLRFWWRATRGGQFGKDGLKQMKTMEDEIWGSTATASKVSLSIAYPDEASRKGEKFQDTHKRNGHSVPTGDPASKTGYVAFPLRQIENNGIENEVVEKIAFILTISFEEQYRQDVEASLWAWDTFGGVGARTRRGFGALTCFSIEENGQITNPQYALSNLETNMRNDLEIHLSKKTDFPDNLPHLDADIEKHLRITHAKGSGNSVNVWIHLIDALQQFRHKRPLNGQRPGRNRWPEPDAIRKKARSNPRDRRYPEAIHTPFIDKAPRAAFGLPIIFELRGEGIKATLEGANDDHNRFASPLIMRPLACQNDRYVGIALVLAGSDVNNIPDGLVLKDVHGNPPISAQLTPGEAKQIENKAKKIKPNDKYDGDPDILQAFLNTLKE